jgi:hypothetical protein
MLLSARCRSCEWLTGKKDFSGWRYFIGSAYTDPPKRPYADTTPLPTPSTTTADFIKMPEQVGGIFVNPGGPSALKFLLPVTSG